MIIEPEYNLDEFKPRYKDKGMGKEIILYLIFAVMIIIIVLLIYYRK